MTYHLHESFRNPDRTVTEQPEFGFPLSSNGWGTFHLEATVHYQDGTSERLGHQLDFELPAFDPDVEIIGK